MRATLPIALILFTAGCLNWRGPHRPASALELDYVAAARAAWEAAGRGEAVCDGRLERVHIVTPADIAAACEQAPDSGVQACYYGVNRYPGAPIDLAIHLDPTLDVDGRRVGIVHEALHAIRACVAQRKLEAGHRPEWVDLGSDLPDRLHADAELWGPIFSDALRRSAPESMLRSSW